MTHSSQHQSYYSTSDRIREFVHGSALMRVKQDAGAFFSWKIASGDTYLAQQAPFIPNKLSLKHLRVSMLLHLSQCSRLNELGRLHFLEYVGRYTIHWLRWFKVIGIASLNAHDANQYAITQLYETPHSHDMIDNTFNRHIM